MAKLIKGKRELFTWKWMSRNGHWFPFNTWILNFFYTDENGEKKYLDPPKMLYLLYLMDLQNFFARKKS
jgi:hypothetical protein